MDRDSVATRALVAAVNRPDVTGRRIERWSHEGLLPPDGTPPDAVAAHVAALAEVYRPGPGAADRAAMVIAARGFGCESYRDALCRSVSYDSASTYTACLVQQEPPVPLDTTTDEGFETVEDQATEFEQLIDSSSSGLLPTLRQPVSELGELVSHVEIVDPATGDIEDLSDARHAALTNLAAIGIGDGAYSPEVVAAMASQVGGGLVAPNSDMLADFIESLGGGFFFECERLTVEAPLDQLVRAATIFRQIFAQHDQDRESGDVLAARGAPALLALVERLGPLFERTATLPPGTSLLDAFAELVGVAGPATDALAAPAPAGGPDQR